jgi:hypothetical protein
MKQNRTIFLFENTAMPQRHFRQNKLAKKLPLLIQNPSNLCQNWFLLEKLAKIAI